MDPLSITTGTFALIAACRKAAANISKFRGLRHAPALIHALNNEISDLQLALSNVNDYLQKVNLTEIEDTSNLDKPLSQLCSSVLDQARNKVQEVESLIHYQILKAGGEHAFQVNRVAFLSQQTRLSQLQADLRYARQQIASLFAHLGMRETSKIEVMIKDLQVSSNHTRAEVLKQLSVLTEGQRGIQEVLGHVSKTPPASYSSSDIFRPERTEVQDTREYVQISVGRLPQLTPRQRCNCPRWRTSWQLQSYLGNLFTGYVAKPVTNKHRLECFCNHSAELLLVYVFPLWFLDYAFSFHAHYNRANGLTCSLSIAPVLPYDHVIWDLIRDGDLKSIDALLYAGEVSIRSESETALNGGLLFV